MQTHNTPRIKILGYLLSGFPRLTETFILSEMVELERLGMDLIIFSLKRGSDFRANKERPLLRSPAIYVPEKIDSGFLMATFWAALLLFFKMPLRYTRVTVRFWASGKKERYFRLLKSYLRWLWLCREIQKHSISRLHAHFAHDPTTMAYWISQLLPCPYSFTAHARDIYCYSQTWLQRKIHQAEFVVTCTRSNKLYFEQISSNDTPIYCVPHGVDLRKFTPTVRERSPKPFILSVGRLVAKKGFPVLLEACAILKRQGLEFDCGIAGDGPLRESLQCRIEELGLQDCVRLLGALIQDMLMILYQKADVFVLPCCIMGDGDRDGTPNVILEAMAMELPVVSTGVAGVPEAVEHGETGLLVQVNHANEVATAIERILSNADMAARMGERGRQKVLQHYEVSKNVNALKELLTA